MEELKEHFITSKAEYREGQVFRFLSRWSCENVKKAELVITALGIYEAEINGKKAGTQMFAPGYTYYPRDLFFQKYDVSSLIKEGTNELEVYLGQGWYCGRFTFDNKTQIYGEKPAVSWILELQYEDGTKQKIFSDDTVKELESPYEYAGFYDGEIYDASVLDQERKEIGTAVPFRGNIPEHLEETYICVEQQEKMPVKEVFRQGDITILDFGQNFAGILVIDPAMLPENGTVKIRHGEVLNPDGTLYTDNLRQAKATLQYKRGKTAELYVPRFTYMGFRYAEVSGAEYKEGMVHGIALYSSMTRTGNFCCSNAMVQKLYENQVWGQKSNYVEVPTDCPQRDERMGYTGDGHVFAWTGSFNYDTELFWKKFLKDVTYSQMDNSEGYIGSTVPATGPAGIGFLSMLGWGNAVTLIPEMLYMQYGKKEYLINQYDSICKFVDAEIRKMGKKNLWIGPSLGDWLMPGKGMAWAAMHNHPVSNAFIVHDLKVVSQLAKELGREEDYRKYNSQWEKTKAAYMRKFINKDGKIKGDYQGAYIMAVKYVVTDEDLKKKMLKRLIKNLKENGMNTGFFSTEHLLPVLAEAGETKLAFDLLLQENCPGWMYQINCGATTTWERWDALKPDGTVKDEKVAKDNMVSFNHYAFGSVGEFYYRFLLGINPLKPGYEKILIKPVTDLRLGKVSGSFQSVKGKILVQWEYQEEALAIHVETPAETKIVLPDGRSFEVTAGSYEYRCYF